MIKYQAIEVAPRVEVESLAWKDTFVKRRGEIVLGTTVSA